MYPENTITAFSKAQEIRGLSGIELDIQLTKDGEVVVIHDERVDRTTDGIGYVKDFTYLQLRKLAVKTGGSRAERIPTISEVLDVQSPSNRRKRLDCRGNTSIKSKSRISAVTLRFPSRVFCIS